ncbi:hypothetical protein DH2020_005683 [Rehmannia glutinosa]|uniref:Protein kinase domain-containing protein n=1 Tax=Rehmannia glutinosa TaxID=99300 RepID=A0ABR0XGQ6_REHGL
MLSRAFAKPRRSPQAGESSLRSTSIFEYEDLIFGFMDDIPLTSFPEYNDDHSYYKSTHNSESTSQMTLRQVLRASVGVMGESPLGMTEKVVLLGFVVCDYYPMGSLADLLSGAREQGHTALEWKQRFKIIQGIAKAISFIHSQNPPREKHLQLNIHGNIKSSNVMINIDFTARLSDYGFVQLADQVAVDDTGQAEPLVRPPPERAYTNTLSQESDIYNFGIVLMDILGWPNVSSSGVIKRSDLFEFFVDREQKKQALKEKNHTKFCGGELHGTDSMTVKNNDKDAQGNKERSSMYYGASISGIATRNSFDILEELDVNRQQQEENHTKFYGGELHGTGDSMTDAQGNKERSLWFT